MKDINDILKKWSKDVETLRIIAHSKSSGAREKQYANIAADTIKNTCMRDLEDFIKRFE